MRSPHDYAEFLQPLQPEPYVVYDPATGEIQQTGTAARYFLDAMIIDERQPYARGEGGLDTHYVDVATRTIRPKPEGSASLNGTLLTGLPNPGTLLIEGETYPVDGGERELVFDQTGTYTVSILSPRVLRQDITVVFNPAGIQRPARRRGAPAVIEHKARRRPGEDMEALREFLRIFLTENSTPGAAASLSPAMRAFVARYKHLKD